MLAMTSFAPSPARTAAATSNAPGPAASLRRQWPGARSKCCRSNISSASSVDLARLKIPSCPATGSPFGEGARCRAPAASVIAGGRTRKNVVRRSMDVRSKPDDDQENLWVACSVGTNRWQCSQPALAGRRQGRGRWLRSLASAGNGISLWRALAGRDHSGKHVFRAPAHPAIEKQANRPT